MSNPWDQDWSGKAPPPGAAPWEVDWSGKGKTVAKKPEERGMLRGAADLGIELASGVARGVKFTADAFGANNAVSRGAGAVDDFAREYLSAQAKEDDKRIGEIMAAAQDAGIWDQVKAAAEAFLQAPGRMAVNALGTSVPTIAATMIPGVGQAGAAARLGMLGGMGAVQGAGTVKGAIYEAVKGEQMKLPGMTEEAADELATRAQEYGGENTGNIAAGAGLGAAASATGAQPVIAKLLQPKGMLAEAATEGAERGILARTGMGVVKEAPLEAAQGGQEQLAANMALQNEGFDVPTFRGVAGNAALEGLAAGPMGAVAGALDRPVPKAIDETPPKPAADPLAPEAIASVLAAPSLDDAIAAAAAATSPAAQRPRAEASPLAAEIRALEDPQDRQEALGLVATAQNPNAPGPVRRFAQNRLDELLLSSRQPAVGEATELTPDLVNADVALRKFRTPAQISADGLAEIQAERSRLQDRQDAAAIASPLPVGEATDLTPEEIELGQIPVGQAIEVGGPRPEGMPERRNTDGSLIDPTGPNAVAAYVQRMQGVNTPAARAFVQDFNAGRITRDDVMGLLGANPAKPQPTADERLATAAGQKQQILPTDLLTGDGMPYGSKTAAGIRAKKEQGTVVPVEGGWVVRKESDGAQSDLPVPAGVAVPAADGAGDQPGGSVGVVGPVAGDGPAGEVQAGLPPTAPGGGADQPAAGRGSELDGALTAPGGGVMPAGLRVTFGGKTYPVESVEDAQSKWIEFRDQSQAGGSQIGNGVRVVDGAGRFVARVSYNGRIWDTEDDFRGGGRVVAEAPPAAPVDPGQELEAGDIVRVIGGKQKGTVRRLITRNADGSYLVSDTNQGSITVPAVAFERKAENAPATLPDKIKAKKAEAPDADRPANLRRGKSSANVPMAPAAPAPTSAPSAAARWGAFMPIERREILAKAGYTDADQARVLSGTAWTGLTDPVRKALDAVHKQQMAAAGVSPAAPAPKPDKSEIRPYRRADGSIGYEAAPIVEPAPAAPDLQTSVAVRELAARGAALAAKAPAAPAADPALDDELNDALGKLGDVLGDVFGVKKNITGPQYGAADLLPALSKVVELLVRKGFVSFRGAIGKAAQVMRANAATAPHVDAISARQWKAAYQAIADGTPGTDTEESVAAMTAQDVAGIVAGIVAAALPEKVRAKKAEEAAPEPAAPAAEPEPEAQPAAAPARNEAVIELRKRLSVLNALRTCLG